MASRSEAASRAGGGAYDHEVISEAAVAISAPAPVAIAVLGEVTLHDARGHEVPLAPQKREILAALAAAAGANVPRDALLRSLWSDDSVATRNRLKSQVAQLRTQLDRGLTIEYRNSGYRLCGPLELLDSTLFESIVSRARELSPDAAAERYGLALRLWRRDTPFANVTTPLVDVAARRLAALRDEVVLALADCDIERQRPGSALSFVEEIFDDDPARGDVTRRLALLFALASRHVDALRVIERHRETLADIGAVISPDVAEVESQILRHEVPLAPMVAAAAARHAQTLPVASPAGWLDRDAWVDRIVVSLEHGPVVLVGEPGVGKTSLSRMVEQRLTSRATPTIRVAVLRDPYRPMDVVASIAEQLEVAFPERFRSVLENPAAASALARIAGPEGAPRSPTTREVLLADLTGLIADTLEHTDALLVIEDAQWLDSTSADVVGALVRHHRPRMLVTSRPPLPPAVGIAVADTDLTAATVLEIPPFDAAEVTALIHQVLPLRASEHLTTDLLRQTGGNPLFLGLSLDVLARGELGSDLPTTLQSAVDDRTADLSRSTREVLQLAALLGQTFPIDPLLRIRSRAVEALRDGAAEGLIRIDEDGTSAQFVHGLVAGALASTVSPGMRPSWHDELCRALLSGGHTAIAIGNQAVGAAEIDPVRAVVACRNAAAEHATVFEWGQAIDWAQRGLQLVTQSGMTGQLVEAELHALLGTGLRRANHSGSDVELLVAAEIASDHHDDDLFVRVVTEACLHGPTSQAGKVDPRVRRHLDRALTLPLDDGTRAELLSAAATLTSLSDESGRGRAHYLEARDLAARCGDHAVLRSVSMNAHLGLAHPDDLPLRWHAASELDRFDDAEARWEAAFLRFGLGLITADRALVEQSVGRLRETTPLVLQRGRARGLLQIEAAYSFVCGRLDEAERLADTSLAVALESYSESWSHSIHAALVLPIYEVRRRTGMLAGVVSAMLRGAPGYLTWHAVAACVASAQGDVADVRHHLEVLRAGGLRFALDLTWTAAATTVARPIWHVRDEALAADLYTRLAPFSGQMSWNGLSTHGPVDAGLALLAATLGDADRVRSHLDVARQLVEGLEAPHLWWAELDLLAPRAR